MTRLHAAGICDCCDAPPDDGEERDLRGLWLSRLMFNPFVGWAPETRSFEQFCRDATSFEQFCRDATGQQGSA